MLFPKTLVIHVTQDDIDKGDKSSPYSCPIQRALRPMLPADHTVKVYTFGVSFMRDDFLTGYIDYPLSTRAKKFIDRFDSGKPVKPITFRLSRNRD